MRGCHLAGSLVGTSTVSPALVNMEYSIKSNYISDLQEKVIHVMKLSPVGIQSTSTRACLHWPGHLSPNPQLPGRIIQRRG